MYSGLIDIFDPDRASPPKDAIDVVLEKLVSLTPEDLVDETSEACEISEPCEVSEPCATSEPKESTTPSHSNQEHLINELDYIDSIIMNHFDKGLPYFTGVLQRYNQHIHTTFQTQPYIHIKTYLQTYLIDVLTPKIVCGLCKSSPDQIPLFHQILISTPLPHDIRELWMKQLYDGLVEYASQECTQELHYLIHTLLECKRFATYFSVRDTDRVLNCREIEKKTLLGVCLHQYAITDFPSKRLIDTLAPLFTHCPSFLSRWTTLIQGKNLPKRNLIGSTTLVCTDIFMLYMLQFLVDLRDHTKQDTIDEVYYNVYIHSQIEYAILPLFNKYHHYTEKLEDVHEYLQENESTQLRALLTKKADYYKKLILDHKNLTFDTIFTFYHTVATEYLACDPSTLPITSHDTMQCILNYTIQSNRIFFYTFTENTAQIMPIYRLALAMFLGRIPNINPHYRLLAFRCFYHLYITHSDYRDFPAAETYRSILEMYIKAHGMDDDPQASTSCRTMMSSFLNKHTDIFLNHETTEVEQLERILSIFTSEVNEYTTTFKEAVQSLCKTDTTTELISNALLWTFQRCTNHMKLIRMLFIPVQSRISCGCIIPILSTYLQFSCNTIHSIHKAYPNLPSAIQQQLNKVCRECTKTIICITDQTTFIDTFAHPDSSFSVEAFQYAVSHSGLDGIEGVRTLLERCRTKQAVTVYDYPTEFLDPLLCTPITEPVVLPHTQMIMDKAVIHRYLLDKQENPFDRTTLTQEEVDTYNKEPEAYAIVEAFLHDRQEWELENTESSTNES